MVPDNVQMFPSDLSIGPEATSTPLDDIDGIVALYQPRIYRFLLGTLRDHDAAETLPRKLSCAPGTPGTASARTARLPPG
jgi:hypothetical protein